MTDEAMDRRLERLERLLRGDDLSSGVVAEMKSLRKELTTLDQKLDGIDYKLAGILEKERHRRDREKVGEAERLREGKDRRFFIRGFVASIVLVVLSSIGSAIIQVLLALGS